MLSFRDFRTTMDDKIENYRTTLNATNTTGQSHIDKNGYPCAVVFHGGHSAPLKKSKKSGTGKTTVKEAKDDEWHHFNDNHHLGNTTNQVHWNLTKHYADRPEEHTAALHKYTTSSTMLNRTLYDDHIEGRKTPNSVPVGFGKAGDHHELDKIDTTLSHKPLHDNLHVYSGVHFDVGDVASKHPDRHIHLPAYTSASIDKGVAKDFAHRNKDVIDDYRGNVEHAHILHVSLPKGHHGSYVGLASHYENEKEFLIPRGTTLHVHPDHTEHTDVQGRKFKIWHATPVEHKPL